MKIYTDEELQVAIDVAFSAKTGEAYLARRPDVATKSWPQESLLRLAIAKAFLEKLESDPYAALKKAHAEGKVIQHRFSGHLPWNDTDKPEFLSGREYRIKPEPETPWNPAVGDVVQLKSGGPKMTVMKVDKDQCRTLWDVNGEVEVFDFFNACLTPVTE